MLATRVQIINERKIHGNRLKIAFLNFGIYSYSITIFSHVSIFYTIDIEIIQLSFTAVSAIQHSLNANGEAHQHEVLRTINCIKPNVLANILEALRDRSRIDRNVTRKHHPMWIFVINNMKVRAIILRALHKAINQICKSKKRSRIVRMALRLPFFVLYLQSGV